MEQYGIAWQIKNKQTYLNDISLTNWNFIVAQKPQEDWSTNKDYDWPHKSTTQEQLTD